MSDRFGRYLLSLPERLVRSASGLAGGLVRELGDIALPAAVRRTRLYQNLVENTLRFLIEQVGEVRGTYPDGTPLSEDFAIRRAAGNGIEMAGIVAFRASPVWVMAALADLSGTGRKLIGEITGELAEAGLLESGAQFTTVDQLLEGLERFSARTAETINTPPLDVAALRRDWAAIRGDAVRLPSPAVESLERLWAQLRKEAAAQGRSVFALSSLMALSAVSELPGGAVWLSRSAAVAARRTGELLGEKLLGHYRRALGEIHTEGYLRFWTRVYRPYLRAAAAQFSREKPSLTEKVLARRRG
ncbi:MAG: hypothetical protein R2729_32170 [Bryobacteraceae bacterium]